MPHPNLALEKDLWSKGLNYIVGIDEVGRGSWAGPLVAAGVILPENFKVPRNFADSKQLSKQAREYFNDFIKSEALGYKIVEVQIAIINKIGIGKATQLAFRKITRQIAPKPNYTLIDAFYIKYLAKSKQKPVKHGDEISASIAAASIIAKVHRDNLMEEVSKTYPKYGFEKHKGYGTTTHQTAIKKYGFCEIHRINYNLNFLFS